MEPVAMALGGNVTYGKTGWMAGTAAVLMAGAFLAAATAPAQSAEKKAAGTATLAKTAVNAIVKKPALKAQALALGAKVYKAQCALCHGADLKGVAAKHTPDLTDHVWLYSGDDLDSGGIIMFPADVEKTVLYGIRSGHPKARNEALMPGLGPNDKKVLNDAEINDVLDYTLQISHRAPSSPEAAARGKALFTDKGNCFDCHLPDGTGNGAIGSTDLTNSKVYLYGTDRATMFTTIREGVAGKMPAFEGQLSPTEIKAVSVYVFSKAPPPPKN